MEGTIILYDKDDNELGMAHYSAELKWKDVIPFFDDCAYVHLIPEVVAEPEDVPRETKERKRHDIKPKYVRSHKINGSIRFTGYK